MTLEEIKDFLKDDKNAAEFKGFVRGMGYEGPDDIKGLKEKNEELLRKLKKEKEDAAEKQKILDNIDIDEYNDLRNKKGKETDKDAEARLQREIKKAEDRAKIAEEKESKTNAFLNSVLIRAQLSEAIDANNFDVKHKDLLLSAFSGRAKVEVDDKGYQVIIDNGDALGVPANDFFKNYATSEQGKSYLRQADNRGSGSQTYNTANAGKTMKRESFNSLSSIDQMKVIKDGVKVQD